VPDFPEPEKLDSMKDSLTPTAKLFNWNLIKTALDMYEIKLSDEEKSLIVAGDTQIIADLIKQIKSKIDEIEKPTPAKAASKSTSSPNGMRYIYYLV